MGLREVDLREEGLLAFQLVPVGRVERGLISVGTKVGEIPICLACAAEEFWIGIVRWKGSDIGGLIARGAKPICDNANAGFEFESVFAVRPMIVSADAVRVHAGHERGSAGGTYWSHRKRPRVANPVCC